MTEYPETFVTSDPHLGHRLVAGHRGFGEDTAKHDAYLAEQWDAVVQPRDTVWVLGDLCMGGLDYALNWISERPGTKHLVAGNHDSCHPMHRRWLKATKRYAEVFDTVGSLGSLRCEGETVMLSHFPRGGMEGADRSFEPRYLEWRVRDSDRWLLHGHTHMADQRLHGGNQIHCGLDAWDLAPVNLRDIGKIIRENS